MPYIDYKAEVKNAQIKKDGVVEIKLEANVSALNGEFNHLSEMVGEKVDIGMEGSKVNFNVTINAKTDKPMHEYKVNEEGIVEEVKSTEEQLKADKDLGLPEEEVPTLEEEKEIDREVVDKFIHEGVAPNFDDLPSDFANFAKRRLEGESYRKLAEELAMEPKELVETMDDYRKRVAPLAEKWKDWKDAQAFKDEEISDESAEDNTESDPGNDEDEGEEGAA